MRRLGRSPFLSPSFLLLAAFGHVLLFARVASADSLRAIVDLGYAKDDMKTTDSAGGTTQANSNIFTQRYRLFMNKSFFPNLSLDAGGLFERVQTDSDTGGAGTTAIDTKTRPYFDLRLTTPLYQAGVGYSRREGELKATGVPSTTDVNDEWHVIAGWKPDGFPDWSVRLNEVDTFDKARIFEDTTTKQAIVIGHYAYKGLDLRYQPSYRDTVSRIDGIETKEVTQSGRALYSGTFFRNRTTLSASYEITNVATEIVASGTGEVSFPLFPLAGLSALDDTPTDGALDLNPALVDGNLAAGAGLNLGLPPAGGDTRARNMGLDFGISSETNTLFVWIDRELPPEIATAFSWTIYTSSDNLNWALQATVFPAPFGPFQNRFEIRFPNVTARFIKVVTRPLSLGVPRALEFPDIFVTEIQAFVRRPAADVRGKTTHTSQTATADIRTRILDNPSLFYELSFFLVGTNPPSQTRYTVTNGLSMTHRFSNIFSASGRVTREDIDDPAQRGAAYTYSASLEATPVKTLRHLLLFSGRNEQLGAGSQDRYSLFLRNNAQLYRGIGVSLDGGLSRTTSDTGEEQNSTNLVFGATIAPHRTLTLALNFTGTTTDRTGGGKPDQTTVDRRGDASLAYRPFPTLYLLASVSRVEREDIRDTLQSYAVNWSPFPSGALQFNFAFEQELAARDNSKTRSIRPSLRWNVTKSIILDMSYRLLKTESRVETVDDNTFSTNLELIY